MIVIVHAHYCFACLFVPVSIDALGSGRTFHDVPYKLLSLQMAQDPHTELALVKARYECVQKQLDEATAKVSVVLAPL